MSKERAIWITGAGGFIGRQVALEAKARGHPIVGLGHKGPDSVAHFDEFVAETVSQRALDALLVRHGEPWAIIHLAGGSSVAASIADPEEDRRRTLGSSETLRAWLSRSSPRTRLVAASSAAVYGDAEGEGLSEQLPPRPSSPYGRHKLEMEALFCNAAAAGQPTAIVRLFSVFGAGLRKQLFYDLARRAAAGERPLQLLGTGHEQRDFICGSDAARLLIDVTGWADSPALILNGGSGHGTTIAQAASLFANAWEEVRGETLPITFSGVSREGDPIALVAETSRLRELGFVTRGAMESELSRFVSWFCGSEAPC